MRPSVVAALALALALSGCEPRPSVGSVESATFATPPRAAPAARRGADRAEAPRVPVVVELFSSEGCSSCPPADEALRALADEQPVAGVEVIPLELHVDYWNDLGWSDPFSKSEYSLRQHAYADARGARGVFTPEAIVDGGASVVATQKDALVARIRDAAGAPHAEVALRVDGSEARISLGPDAAARSDTFDTWLAITESGLSTEVLAGENRGRTLRHAPVVRALRRLGHPENAEIHVPLPELPDEHDRYRVVVLLQSNTDGHLLGAATARL